MNKTTATQQASTSTFTPSSGNLLQRKCACGNHTMAGGECTECTKKKTALQRKLTIGASNDPLELEADRVADQVMAAPRHSGINTTPLHIQRLTEQTSEADAVPESVDRVLSSSGRSLEPILRQDMEQRFGHDFSRVRVHTDSSAKKSARDVNAHAYTVGHHIVFGENRFLPGEHEGRRLIAHELTHVVQQDTNARTGGLSIDKVYDRSEHEVDRTSRGIPFPEVPTQILTERDVHPIARTSFTSSTPNIIHRQSITPLAPGGGFGGLMERDRRRVMEASGSPGGSHTSSYPYKVCSRDLQGFLGNFANHAYVDAHPFRYAIISPLCPASQTDNPITGTTAQKWDNSPDPCGKTSKCVDCHPAPGIVDVGACLRSAFTAYNSLSLYRGIGPNSNTFAGTLARTCCADMVPKPATLGIVPGWDDSPAPSRSGATPCPPGPTC